MDKPKKLVCPFEWSRQESEHRSRYFCQRQNTIPAHTFFDNYCCGLGRRANIVRDASVKDRTRFLLIHFLITIVVVSAGLEPIFLFLTIYLLFISSSLVN